MDDKKSKNDNKQLINIIQAQYSRLSKGQKLIAQYIINNYDKVAFMTASKLGEAVGVSESTVVRFANALGYAGYPKLQEGLQELIKNKLTTVQRVEMANEDYSDDSTILSKVLKSDIDNIKTTSEDLDEKAFEEASQAASDYAWDLYEEQLSDDKQFMKDNGLVVTELSDEDREVMKEKIQPVYDYLNAQYDWVDDVRKMVDDIKVE